MNEIKVSFIIPHKGREEMLLQTLASIQSQQTGLGGVEIILISQNEERSDELQELISRLPIQLIECVNGKTISALRNLGVSQAKGEFLAFLDADIELAPDWLSTMLETMQQRQNCVLVSAHQVNSADAPPLERLRTALSNAELDAAVTFLPGRNLFLTRQTFEQVGGFPEHLITCEDYYFTERVSQLGEMFYTSKTHYIHLGEDKIYLEMFKKEIWRGQSNLASIKGRHIPLREWPSFVVPLGLLALLLAALLTALGQFWQLSAIALLLFCAPLLVYTLRLKALVKDGASLGEIIKFYGLFFPARALGTLSGALKEIKTSSHK